MREGRRGKKSGKKKREVEVRLEQNERERESFCVCDLKGD
jgi:hypothetical protein